MLVPAAPAAIGRTPIFLALRVFIPRPPSRGDPLDAQPLVTPGGTTL
jgi:hypothetical protein